MSFARDRRGSTENVGGWLGRVRTGGSDRRDIGVATLCRVGDNMDRCGGLLAFE